MTFANELKPPLDEALEHYGVKGMKWGVRRDRVAKRKARAKRNDEIRTARVKVDSKKAKIRRQVDTVNTAKAGKQQADAFLKLNKMQSELLKDPDTITANRMTTGEKAAIATIAIAFPGPGTVGAAGYVSGMALRKSVAKKRVKGTLNK